MYGYFAQAEQNINYHKDTAIISDHFLNQITYIRARAHPMKLTNMI